MKQQTETLYAFDERDYLVAVNPDRHPQQLNKSEPLEIDMPDHIENIKLERSSTTYPRKCDSCPESERVMFTLIVGDTRLMKVCAKCKGRLKKCVNKKPSRK